MATIEIDGKTFEVENGKMIIEVADEAGIYIPRFCYHKKLSVAANCRMCLVEVENSRKTLPACATPITNGMKVFTKSKEAIRSQQAVMDFLLINHPLDCPICDQGGECELQDISMGFGHDASVYEESKRSVVSDDLGPLIATEMTRCIHCTRCVRFGDEIAGVAELGATGRGENMQIGTYIQHSMTSEVSANVIDLCPVGALTSKPFQFRARAWEMSQHDSVAPHDCLGSNIHIHTRRNELMRVVPKEHESINETWLSDQDRFSYLGLNHTDRTATPMIKRDGVWENVDWKTALEFTAKGLSHVIKHYGPQEVAVFASSSQTLEEYYLLQKLMRELGVNNLDHRLQQTDFRDQEHQPAMPTSSMVYQSIENQDVIFLLGCNVAREVPLASTRIRKAQLNGAQVYALNSVDYSYHFAVTEKIIASPLDMVSAMAEIVLALAEDIQTLPEQVQRLLIGLKPSQSAQNIARALKQPKSVIVSGALIENHPEAALLRTLVNIAGQLSDAKTLRFTTGANACGAHLAGMLPHRSAAGKATDTIGLNVQEALDAKLKGYVLFGAEPEFDFSNPYRTRQSMLAAEFVVAVTAYQSESLQEYANVILPMAPYAETSGTYINVDHVWQSVKGAIKPYGEARPAWKIFRVLANFLHCDGFDYASSDEVLAEIKEQVDKANPVKVKAYYPESLPVFSTTLTRVGEWPLYRSDAIVRRASALQACAAAETACIRVHPETAEKYHLCDVATVSQADIEITLPLLIDERLARDVVWVANAMPETIDLGHAFSSIVIKQ